MDYEYMKTDKFEGSKVHLVYDKNGHLFIRKNVQIDSQLAEKLAGISCPRIVKFIEFGEDDGGKYVIEEYIDGRTAAESSLTQKQTLKMLIDLCEALEAIHSAKIVHRDIKPSNIIITKDGHAKLIDFDAARIEKVVKEKDTQILGTEGFAPPEQFGFSQTDSRSDIYSFGVTMNMLLGEKSAPYVNIIKKCKALDPNDRYDNISQVKTAIRLAALKRFAVIPAAALMLIVFTVVLSTVLNHRVPTENMIGIESGESSDSYQSPDSLQNSETSQSSDQPQSPKPSQSSEPSQDSDPPQSSESPQSSEPSQSSEPPQSLEPPKSSEPPQISDPPQSSLPSQGSEPPQSYDPPQSSEPLQNINPPHTSEPSGIVPFFSTVKNPSGDYEDVCDYVFNDDPSVHGSWNAVGTLEKRYLGSFTKGRTDHLIRSINNMLIQTVTLSSDGSANANNSSGVRWTKDYFILKYNNTQFVEELIYAKVNGTEYLLIEDKTGGYAKTGATDKYFVFMNANSRKIIYTTTVNDRGYYDDRCDFIFYDDPDVYGTWEVVGGMRKDDYDKWISGVLIVDNNDNYWFKKIIFLSNGTAKTYLKSDRYFNYIWTNGYFLTQSDESQKISEYFIVTLNGIDYLLLENKNGDYMRELSNNIYILLKRSVG